MSARRTARRARPAVLAALALVGSTLVGVIGCTSLVSPTSATSPSSPSSSGGARQGHHHDRDNALGKAGGAVPDGTTVFDDDIPAVANLDPDLLRALRRAADDARDDGVEFHVNSGWRSPAYQEKLLREAVRKYGSKKAAAKWVATPSTSLHVSGKAVDIGQKDATAWLSRHGAAYGLCQIYRNEPWHYELRSAAVAEGCPLPYADPTHDPRLQ